MSTPTKTRMPIAIDSYSNLDLSCKHVTTTDFMQFNVAKIIPVVKGQSFSIQHETFTRLEPLAVPTFGDAHIYNRAYFVPNRTIFPAWEEFITNVPHVYADGTSSIITSVPFVTEGIIANTFILPSLSEELDDVATVYDFKLQDVTTGAATQIGKKYKLTNFGRRMWKLMRTLGYSMFMNTSSVEPVSLLPLYAVARVYLDFYYPAQYANDDDSNFVLSVLQNNEYSKRINSLSEGEILRIFRIIDNVCYHSDLFTQAWDNPNSPNNGLSSPVTIPDVNDTVIGDRTTSVKYEGEPYNSAPYLIDEKGSSLNKISQFAINALRKLTDYMKRHQLAGSRVIDRYLARFGVALSSDKLRRSYKLFEKVDNLHFGDVTSTSDTEGAALGAFAGKGVGFNQGSFEFTSEQDYGYIVMVSTIVPVTKMYQGVNRITKHLSPLDFWTPEFDGLGVQAISSQEVYSPVDGSAALLDYAQKVFGFGPRYYELKIGYDLITGDYILRTMNAGKDSWTLFRDMKPYVDSIGGADNLVHDFDFINGSDAQQFNRIFNNTASNADHFNVVHNFVIKSRFPGRSLWDTYEFETDGKAKSISMEVGGRTEN